MAKYNSPVIKYKLTQIFSLFRYLDFTPITLLTITCVSSVAQLHMNNVSNSLLRFLYSYAMSTSPQNARAADSLRAEESVAKYLL